MCSDVLHVCMCPMQSVRSLMLVPRPGSLPGMNVTAEHGWCKGRFLCIKSRNVRLDEDQTVTLRRMQELRRSYEELQHMAQMAQRNPPLRHT